MQIKTMLKITIGSAIAAILAFSAGADQPIRHPGPAQELTLYSGNGFTGRSQVFRADAAKLSSYNFSNIAKSMQISGGLWEVCNEKRFRDRCEVFGAGQYELAAYGWGSYISSLRRVSSNTDMISLFSKLNFRGQERIFARKMDKLKRFAFIGQAASLRVSGGLWKVCTNSNMGGHCQLVDQNIADLSAIGMSYKIASVAPAKSQIGHGNHGQITLFEDRRFSGTRINVRGQVADLRRAGFSNRASSVRLNSGEWELCENRNFGGRCEVVRHDVRNLNRIALDDRISSIRPYIAPVADYRPAPTPNWDDDNRYGQGIEGQRTVFFPEPKFDDRNIAQCVSVGHKCGRPAANMFCRRAGLRSAVYFETAIGYGPIWYLGARSTEHARRSTSHLVDVLCSR